MCAVVKHLCQELLKINGVNGVYTLIKVANDGTDGQGGTMTEPGEPRDVAIKAGLTSESLVFKGKFSLGSVKALYVLK